LIRQLATDTNQTVLDHITMLESTGMVDFDNPPPNSPLPHRSTTFGSGSLSSAGTPPGPPYTLV
ncbi:hypothetical protein ABZS89_40635, partial [Streptomyces sp. NPDC005407]